MSRDAVLQTALDVVRHVNPPGSCIHKIARAAAHWGAINAAAVRSAAQLPARARCSPIGHQTHLSVLQTARNASVIAAVAVRANEPIGTGRSQRETVVLSALLRRSGYLWTACPR